MARRSRSYGTRAEAAAAEQLTKQSSSCCRCKKILRMRKREFLCVRRGSNQDKHIYGQPGKITSLYSAQALVRIYWHTWTKRFIFVG